jgi:hypothetical protein
MTSDTVTINRAPVLTLWGAVVAEHLGYDEDEALSLGKCLAGLNAQTKGRTIGVFSDAGARQGGETRRSGLGEETWVQICGRPLPAKRTQDGLRAVVKDKPIEPDAVRRYLGSKFGDDLRAVKEAMTELADSYQPEKLDDLAYELYEAFRPRIAAGSRGWGAKGELDLGLIRSLATEDPPEKAGPVGPSDPRR